VERHSAAWWKEQRSKGGKGFNWRLLPYLVTSVVTHRAFAWGAGVMLVLMLLLRALLRRWW
jgi:hypothetical protein